MWQELIRILLNGDGSPGGAKAVTVLTRAEPYGCPARAIEIQGVHPLPGTAGKSDG
jgi:hypothetical protein